MPEGKRRLEELVTFRHVVYATLPFLALLGGFGAFVISRAEAAAIPAQRAVERIESKVDRLTELLIERGR